MKDTLTVKWYHNDPHEPIYVWILSKGEPKAYGKHYERINTGYNASDDKYHQYSALEILNPATELSGNYTCQVATLDENSEDEKTKSLIIYCK